MSFWTPYSNEEALDLSKRDIKHEQLSPREGTSAHSPSGPYPPCALPAASLSSASLSPPQYSYFQPPQHLLLPEVPPYIEQPLVPALHFSPDSAASSVLYPDRSSEDISPISVGAESNPAWTGKGSPEARKAPRPFKAVTRALEADGSNAEVVDSRYASFREAMLAAVRARNGGSLCVSNPRMRRAVKRSKHEQADDEYLERRARNNAAAKKSRDLRRLKEDELAIRTAFLEAENQRMRTELEALRRQLSLYQSSGFQT